MTRFGLTTGFGDPIGADLLDALSDLQVDAARQSLRPDSNLEACVRDFSGRRIRPLFLFPRLEHAFSQVRFLMQLVVAHFGPAGADIGIGNESNIHNETIDQAVLAVEHAQHVAPGAGFEGAIYATSIANLEPQRDFGWMKAFWPRLSVEVVRDFHRYPEIRYPWHLDDRHPWHQFSSIEAECEAVLAEAAGGPVSITEFAHSTVQHAGWAINGWHPFDGKVTNEQSADYLTQDLVTYTKAGFTDAMVYQINSGPDPTVWDHCQGIRDIDGNWLPQAECFVLARNILGGG